MWLIRSDSSIAKDFDLRGLRAVLAVAEFGTFRRAAAELGYTQSALSHQVSSLEKALGRARFHRPGGRGQVRLTPAGEAVCRRARRAMAEVGAIAADAEEAERGENVRVRVGVSQTAAAEIMPPALQAFREAHPAVEVVLTDLGDYTDVASVLHQRQLDLAFAVNQAPHESLETVRVLEDSWVILTRRDSALAELERPGFEVLDGLDLVAWTHRWRGQAELERAWSQRGITPRIVYRTDDNLSLQRLVAAGLGHACIGRLAARRAVDPSLTWLPVRESLIPREIILCYPRHRRMTATSLALIAAIRAQTPL
jgi:DNA-binding transcriptional LysR family regulator